VQTSAVDAEQLIATLGLVPHPEGGHYVETWRRDGRAGGRATATAILFLLLNGERSHWHRVDADELWLFHAGDPLRLHVTTDEEPIATSTLGIDLAGGHRPQLLVPAGRWQSAESLGRFTLVSCVVSPGFEFAGFELAPPGWMPS
jgi:uncharacterized protein